MLNKVKSNELVLSLTNVNIKEEDKQSVMAVNDQNYSQRQYLPSKNILLSLNLDEDQKNENGLISEVQYVSDS